MKYDSVYDVFPARLLALAIALSTIALALFFTPTPVVRAAPKAATWHVTKLADTDDHICDSDCSLREAIFVAVNGDTIDFPSLSGTIVLSSTLGLLSIGNDIAIAGPGVANLAISGNNTNSIFSITGNVTVSGLTIRDGNAGVNHGGGVDNSGALTLTNVSVISNTANLGGGVWNNSGKLVLISTTVANNIATGEGGGIYNNASNAVLSLTNSTVSGNSATGSGGGILAGGTVTVTGSVISLNQAGANGGGLWQANATTLTVQSSMIMSNTTNSNGAGIFNGGTMTLTSSLVQSNTAGNFSSGGVGGGLSNQGNATISNTTFSRNVVSGTITSAGAIYNSQNLTLTNTTLDSNSALGSQSNGGGIYMESSTSVLTLNNVTISSNTSNGALGVAGGIYEADGTANLNNVTITRNSAGANGGGGVAIYGLTFNFKNTIIAGNISASEPDCKTGTTLNSQDYNLIGDSTGCTIGGATGNNKSGDPKLTPLAWLGGLTQAHGLLSGSPALNNGNGSTCLSTDQRGVARPVPGSCDIGAFEGIAKALYLPLILR